MSERKPRLTLLCGLSASGKSHYAEIIKKTHDNNNKIAVVSTDVIRENICGSVEDQSKNGEVFQIFHKLIAEYLRNGIDVVAEATNITMKSRRAILNVTKGIDCKKICVVIVKPIDECRKDNVNRKHPVPEYVIEKQARKFQIPFLEEGWDKIEFIDRIADKQGYVAEIENTWIPEEYNDFDQKNPYHLESLGKHMVDAYDFVTNHGLHKDKDCAMIMATKYHDMGKLCTQTFDEDGVAHYYGHENIGAYMMLVYEVANQSSLFTNCGVGDIAFYINYHMLPFQWKPNNTKLETKWAKRFGSKKYHNLWDMHIADLAASKRKDKDVCVEIFKNRGRDDESDL